MSWWLTGSPALSDDTSLVPSIHTEQFKMPVILVPGIQHPLLVSAGMCAHTHDIHSQTQKHTYK